MPNTLMPSALMQSLPWTCRFSLLTLAALAIGASVAKAQELRDPRDKANRICASYGQGLVAGPAPGHCVKVRERLRIAPFARHTRLEDTAGSFVSIQDAPLRDRLRVNGGFGGAAIR